ncbi:beta-hexosaminidase subunit alpha-like [Halichondria panicea]|uniref:beta-hexosaminidase subunit alpha-like n=1 Tax=Halichondria panicea TaxID=6063 RepID=UPI00312BB2F4
MFSYSILLIAALCGAATSDPSTSTDLLWPLPNGNTVGSDMYSLDSKTFMFVPAGKGGSSDVLKEALERYMKLIFLPSPVPALASSITAPMDKLTVTVDSSDETLALNTDNSYMLDTSMSMLSAKTVYGALKGLETFSQLVSTNSMGQFQVPSFKANDVPSFLYRGFMIDTSRHFLEMKTIMDHLDAMAYSKFNVLHWHIVDDQSFPYTSIAFPAMSVKGAYDQNHIYSQDDIAQVIKYAKYRGIRVVVEFDTPGHTQSWGKGIPNLLTPCYANDKPTGTYGPINPTLDSTWTFLHTFFTEIARVFPDSYIHLGGDEVSFLCWESNPDIQKWMKMMNYTNYAQLEQYYETKLLELVKTIGKQYVVWQEIFDNKLEVLPDTVIHVWKGGDNWPKEVYNITKAGLKTLLSSCWYLNYISYGEDWPKYYQCDPLAFNGTAEQQALVVGGEACIWAEYVDSTNFLPRTWPRAGAIAERLWSKTDFSDLHSATTRLHNHRCRLIVRGIPAQPPSGPSFCPHEWEE